MDKDQRPDGPALLNPGPEDAPQAQGGSLPLGCHPPSVWPDFMVGQAEKPVRVLLVDDDSPMSHVIAQELLLDQRIRLVEKARGLRDGRRKMGRLDFDVVLVGLKLGDGTGFDLIEQVKSRLPLVEVVVLSTCEDEAHALHAFELGATGFLVKHSWFGHFAQAVLQVVNGGASITPQLARRLVRRLGGRASKPLPAHVRSDQLSVREREILGLVAGGHTSAEIGSHLEISVQTVNSHIRNLYKKLRVHTRAQAVSCASERGLL